MKLSALKNATGAGKGISCPYCRSGRTRFVLEAEGKTLRKCRECSIVFLHPPLDPEELARRYSREFKCSYSYDIAKIEQVPLDRLGETEFQRHREIGFLREFKDSGRILDLGCSWGFLMLQAREMGFEVKGVEICGPQARYARDRLGLDVVEGRLEDASYPDAHFDGVLAVHVLEHIPDLRKCLGELHRILKDDGVAVIIVPNFDSISRKALGAEWKWLEPNWHSFHFTRPFMRRALRDAGFECTLRSEEGHYGMEFITGRYSPDEIGAIHRQVRGSELIAIARKAR